MNHDIEKIKSNPKLDGQIGENAIWDGPLLEVAIRTAIEVLVCNFGVQVSKAPCECGAGMPITKRAKLG